MIKIGEVLAVSVSVDTVSVNPGQIKYSNNTEVDNETLATKFSEIFEDVTYEDALSKLESDSSVVVIARKVESDKISELQTWMEEEGISSGINIDEDYKRYYPNDTLASTLIGFCGTDNTGLYGLEERWNSVLTGTSGQLTVTSDVNGEAISDELEEYVASENGSNIYLTIDSTVQGIAEKYLQEAVEENNAEYGGVIIMNPQNGEILAMANYPDYDLVPTYHKLAKLLNEHHVKAENNTGCYYRYHHKDIGLSDELLNIFKEHGVKMITASDAHQPSHVGMNIVDIYEKTMK